MDQYVFLGEHLKLFWQLFFATSPRNSSMIDRQAPHTRLQYVRYGYVNEYYKSS